MTAFIIDTQKFIIEEKFPDSSFANFAMSDNYGWEPDNRYIMLHNEDALYDYWFNRTEESGVFYEGLGISENTKHDLFKDWMDE